jgi:hypothetical protein
MTALLNGAASPTRFAHRWQSGCRCDRAFLVPLADITTLDPVEVKSRGFLAVELPAFAESRALLDHAPFAAGLEFLGAWPACRHGKPAEINKLVGQQVLAHQAAAIGSDAIAAVGFHDPVYFPEIVIDEWYHICGVNVFCRLLENIAMIVAEALIEFEVFAV